MHMPRMIGLAFAAFLLYGIALGGKVVLQDSPGKKYDSTGISPVQYTSGASAYPDSMMLAPWHFTDIEILLPDSINNFTGISVDITVKTHIPQGFDFFIAPFNASCNGIPFYCGIQTASDGSDVHSGQFKFIGRGGIFSRWYERDTGAVKTKGYFASSGSEGDFISVRNKFKWDRGRYRLTLYRSGYIPGRPVTRNLPFKALTFSWKDYEHSWVTLKLENLETGDSTIIGSLAFPGKTLVFPKTMVLFLEHYKTPIDFRQAFRGIKGTLDYRQIPDVRLAFGNLKINGLPVRPLGIKPYYNVTRNPMQDSILMSMPRMAQVRYDPATGVIDCETGQVFQWTNTLSPSD